MAWATLSEFERGWLVGLLEGEGCFTVADSERGYVQIQLHMNDRDAVERAAKMLGTKVYVQPQRGKATQDSYRCRIRGSRAVEWMRDLSPHLGLRRQARIQELLG